MIVNSIVDLIRRSGGRFLKQSSPGSGTWIELTHQQSKLRVGHALRDATTTHEARKKRHQKALQSNTFTPALLPSLPFRASTTSTETGQQHKQYHQSQKQQQEQNEHQPRLFAFKQTSSEPRPFSLYEATQQRHAAVQKSRTASDDFSDSEFLTLIDEVLGPVPTAFPSLNF